MEILLGVGVLVFFGVGLWWSGRTSENAHKADETPAARFGPQ